MEIVKGFSRHERDGERNIHFIHLIKDGVDDKDRFSYINKLCIASAKCHNPRATVTLWTNKEPKSFSNSWTNKCIDFISIIDIDDYSYANGEKLERYMHIADRLRLDIMSKVGGIYLDIDMLCSKEFPDYFWESKKPIYCEEPNDHKSLSIAGFSNCILIGPKNHLVWSELKKPWENFDHEGARNGDVGATSIVYPYEKFGGTEYVEVIDRKFIIPVFYYGWEPVHLFMHRRETQFSDAYCIHLWESLWHEKWLFPITKEHIMDVDTTFTYLVRPVIYFLD